VNFISPTANISKMAYSSYNMFSDVEYKDIRFIVIFGFKIFVTVITNYISYEDCIMCYGVAVCDSL